MKPKGGASRPNRPPAGGSVWGVPQATVFDEGWLRVLFEQPRVDVRVKVAQVRGVPEIVALHIDPADPLKAGDRPTVITSAMTHRIPLRQLKGEYLKMSRPPWASEPDTFWEAPRRGPFPLPPERVQEVAEIYRRAVDAGKSPLQAIKDAYHISRATASKYIKRARKAGFLGPARPGRSGEDIEPQRESRA
jgi:hypothetical protein